MRVNMRAIYTKQLSFFGTRGMPSWKYPSLLGLIERGAVDLSPMVAREIALSGASAELRAMGGPTSPGTAVITDRKPAQKSQTVEMQAKGDVLLRSAIGAAAQARTCTHPCISASRSPDDASQSYMC